jgi:catechol 2,3-dioxygenase-like lactoylglutathione lyase family enzyme
MTLPGLRGTDHVGFTVPDMEQAHTFFVDVIGCEHIYSLPSRSSDDDWMQIHLRVHPRAVIREVRFYRCRFGSNFELFEYETPEGQAPQPKNSDIGGHHLAFYVDDMAAAVDYLRESGVRVLGDPTASGAASAGQLFCYFLSPWGMQLELVSFPGGKAYEATAETLLWHPAHPAD